MIRRFFASQVAGDTVRLEGAEARHAAVLRVRPGDRIIALDGSGEHDVEVVRVAPDLVEGRVVASRRGRELPVHLTLIQALPKGAKMDAIVRMGTEIGVSEFVPALTARAVKLGARVERWRRIAREAAKQCGRATVPVVHDPAPLAGALGRAAGCDLILVPWEGESSRTIAGALRGRSGARRVAVVIGPEGGLDEREVAEIEAAGGVPVSLGPLVLRTETAGLAAAAMVVYALVL